MNVRKQVMSVVLGAMFLGSAAPATGGELFLEAESFRSDGGWEKQTGPAARDASGVAVLNGAGGKANGTATATVAVKDAGRYRIWVRYTSHPKWRGAFHLTALSGDRQLADGLFDDQFQAKSSRDTQVWRSFDAELPEGPLTLRLSKHENHNASGIARNVDCVLLTMDERLVPNHLHFGAPTYLRVTLGDVYDRPTYIHVFADHFHAPWYQHFSLGRSGAAAGVSAKKGELLRSGERTAWCNITPMIYQDSGAMLYVSARHAYTENADRLRATFEFATAPDDAAVVRTLRVDNQPASVAIFAPPNLLTDDHRALLKTDREIAEETGRQADAHAWPTHGKRPERFPFFVSASIGRRSMPMDRAVEERELKTLDYFGFTPSHLRHVGGAWYMHDESYCRPDVEKMKSRLAAAAAEFKSQGGRLEEIVYCELTDEPTGQPLEKIAQDAAYAEKFRDWLRRLGKTPADLSAPDWQAAKIVTAEQRDKFPELYFYSQRFRTRALGDFMATQRRLAEEAYGGTFPVLANFSDGAVYAGNFYVQGVDYFELLDAPDQNAIWGEDWANGSSTYQCGAFNVDLMRAAARQRRQTIGHHLVAHAGRTPWDVKLKATSELARGVKILNSFAYGPSWATHEGGPYWRSHVWQAKPETWTDYAAITREVGAVEQMLVDAMPAPAKVALLYSSASDVWTVHDTYAYGFDRMHHWLALTHAQMPVDVVSERQAAEGLLGGYQVCCLSGPNLSREAAEKLAAWVRNGGTLWLTAGAATRDEFNRPLATLDDLLPAARGATVDLQKHLSSGRPLARLTVHDQVRWTAEDPAIGGKGGGKGGGTVDVLAVRQTLEPRRGATTLGKFKDDSPAIVRGPAGAGSVYCVGFLPSLAYVRTALVARETLAKKVADGEPLSAEEQADAKLLERSANPWQYPDDVRELLLLPVRRANVAAPIVCGAPLVDAVYMPHATGVLVPLANYTNRPIERLSLRVSVPRRVRSVESVLRGPTPFRQTAPTAAAGVVELSLPLDNNDYLKLMFE